MASLDDCKILAVTDAAILVVYDGERIWFPKSQVADAEAFEAGDEDVTVSVTEWIAKKNGIDA